MKLRRPEILALIISSYMLLALFWWAILLYKKNEALYQSERQNYDYQSTELNAAEKVIGLKQIDEEYSKQRWMIIGEGLFLATSMLIGVYIILRAAKKQINLQNQQNNFLLSITHELKTPIATIKLILQTLIKRQLPKEKTTELVQQAQSENTRLEKLVDNLLTSAKLEDGYPYHFEKIELNQLISKIVKSYNALDQNKVQYLEYDKPAYILGDTQALNLVFNNLINNGLRYGEEVVRITLKKDKDRYVVDLIDHGDGIPKAFQKKMFDKFTRSKDEDIRTHKGTGLGLFIVNEILQGHEGKISYSSDPKSTFTIRLKSYHS